MALETGTKSIIMPIEIASGNALKGLKANKNLMNT